MTVTYDVLLEWPDAASIDSEAEGLIKQGESFYDAVAAAKGAWDGLSENYEAPEQQQLLHALDPALRNAESTTAATALVASAMGGFASALQELEPRRKQLISDAEAFNAKECPSDDAGCAAHQEEEQEIQQRINALAEEYRQKITDCTTHLAGINSEGGYSDPNAPDLGGYIQGQGAGLATSLAQSRERVRVRVSRALRLWTNIGDTKVMQWLAKRRWMPSWLGKIKGSIRLPLPPQDDDEFPLEFQRITSSREFPGEIRHKPQGDVPWAIHQAKGRSLETDRHHGHESRNIWGRRGKSRANHNQCDKNWTSTWSRLLRVRHCDDLQQRVPESRCSPERAAARPLGRGTLRQSRRKSHRPHRITGIRISSCWGRHRVGHTRGWNSRRLRRRTGSRRRHDIHPSRRKEPRRPRR